MVIDAHGHVTAPDKLYVYKAGLISHRGAHGRGSSGATEDDVAKALNEPVFGGSSHLEQLKEAGTDMQLVSPRPYQMMHSEHPKLVNWFMEETNNVIAKQTKLAIGALADPARHGVADGAGEAALAARRAWRRPSRSMIPSPSRPRRAVPRGSCCPP